MNLMARQGRLKAEKMGRNWFTTLQWLEDYKNRFNNRNSDSEKYIPLKEAARVYGCTQRHLSLVARQGKLRALRTGRNWVTTFKWLKEYVDSVKKEELVPFKFLKTEQPWSVKKIVAVSLSILLLFCFFSTLFVGLKDNSLPGANYVINYSEKVLSAYSSALVLTKDSFGSLVFNSLNFAKNSFIKIADNNVKDINKTVAYSIRETNKILEMVIDSSFGEEIDKLAIVLNPLEEATFTFAEKYAAVYYGMKRNMAAA